jgi:hypothetical protein
MCEVAAMTLGAVGQSVHRPGGPGNDRTCYSPLAVCVSDARRAAAVVVQHDTPSPERGDREDATRRWRRQGKWGHVW